METDVVGNNPNPTLASAATTDDESTGWRIVPIFTAWKTTPLQQQASESRYQVQIINTRIN